MNSALYFLILPRHSVFVASFLVEYSVTAHFFYFGLDLDFIKEILSVNILNSDMSLHN